MSKVTDINANTSTLSDEMLRNELSILISRQIHPDDCPKIRHSQKMYMAWLYAKTFVLHLNSGTQIGVRSNGQGHAIWLPDGYENLSLDEIQVTLLNDLADEIIDRQNKTGLLFPLDSQKTKSVSKKVEEKAIECRALEALRAECRDQEEVNAMLWAIVASLKQAKKEVS